MKSVWQVGGGTKSAFSTLLGASLFPDNIDKAALAAQLAIPRNELLAEAAALSPAMATLFSHQAHSDVEASVRVYSICLALTRLRNDA